MNEKLIKQIIALYKKTGIPVDKLHHTHEFDRFCDEINRDLSIKYSKHDIYNELLRLRKIPKNSKKHRMRLPTLTTPKPPKTKKAESPPDAPKSGRRVGRLKQKELFDAS